MNQIAECKFNVLNKVKSATTLSKSNTLEQMNRWEQGKIARAWTLKSSLIRKKGKSQNGGNKKTKHAKFSVKQTLLVPPPPPGCVHVLFSCYLRFLFCLIIDEIDKKFTSNQSFRLRLFVPVSQLLCKTLTMCRLSRFVSHVFDTF